MKQNRKSAASLLAAVAGLCAAGFAGLQVTHQAHYQSVNRPLASDKSLADANSTSHKTTSANLSGDDSDGAAKNPAKHTGVGSTTFTNPTAVNRTDPSLNNSKGSRSNPLGDNPQGMNKTGNKVGTSSARRTKNAGSAGKSNSRATKNAKSGEAPGGAAESTVLGSGNGSFDDTVKPGYLSNMEVLVDFAKAVGMKPDPSGTSPFKDVPTSSPNWGIVHAMTERHMVGPGIPGGKFGATRTFRIRDLSSLYLNYFNVHISPSIYDPGFDQTLGWAKTVGLLNGVVGGYPTSAYKALGPGDGLCVRPQDMTNFLANVKAFERGYRSTSQGYFQLIYPVADEAGTFAAGKPPDGYQASITKTYHIMNDILVKQSGNDVLLSLPTFPLNNEWKLVVGNKVQKFSLDNGTIWITTANQAGTPPRLSYDSNDNTKGGLPARKVPARVLIKSPIGAPLWIHLYDGHDLVANESIGWASGTPTITRNGVSSQGGA